MTSFGCVPFASVCPWARCVEAMTSFSSSAWQTPTATASWPIATWRNPGSSPARKRSSTFSSKRRMSSISRRNSFRRPLDETCPFSSSVATRRQASSPRLDSASMRLAEQWQEIEASLPEGWTSAQLSLAVAEDADADRVALILASLTPGRTGTGFRLQVRPSRNPEGIVRRLDREGIRGRIDLIGTGAARAEAPVVEPRHRQAPLTSQWDELVGDLPHDWSELYAEVELASSDFLS